MFQHPRFALMLHKSGCFADVYGKPLLVSDLCTCSFSESTLPSLYYIEVTPFLQDVRGKVITEKSVLSSCGHVIKDFESEAKTRYNF